MFVTIPFVSAVLYARIKHRVFKKCMQIIYGALQVHVNKYIHQYFHLARIFHHVFSKAVVAIREWFHDPSRYRFETIMGWWFLTDCKIGTVDWICCNNCSSMNQQGDAHLYK